MGAADASALKEAVFQLAQQYLAGIDAQIYICADGDIFVIAPLLPSKDGKAFILGIADFLQRPAGEDWVSFHEVSLEINKLLIVVEQKLDRQRRAAEEKRKLNERQEHARKRHAILNGGMLSPPTSISTRRRSRTHVELMMIEDDAFSRRLVDNILQKKYRLTGLVDAIDALDIYARLAPDLLFLDINLPDVTGHELLECILKLDPDAHVIMLSGNSDQNNILQAMRMGAKGFIAKPFTKDKIIQTIDRCTTIASKNLLTNKS
jgi:two-component system chemotaxis response regulator CheY